MAEGNQPMDNLGGFANPRFVLINGCFWNSNLTRRYIQGQVWLNEFTNLLLESFLQLHGSPMYGKKLWNKETKTHEYVRRPLQQLGSLEILKYGEKHACTLYRPREFNPMQFGRRTEELLALRNDMTHEVGKWTQADTRDTLKKLLEKMVIVSEYLVKCSRHDVQLHNSIRKFKSSCERELDQMRRLEYKDLY